LQRLASLEYGRASFHVTDDGKRPFQIAAAGQVISANRSVLNVSNDSGAASVTLIQGTAMVAPAGPVRQGEARSLIAGQRLIASRAQKPQLDKPDLSRLLAWQLGQAIFDNDSLANAIHEMNRYSTTKLEIADPVIADLRVSGVYRVGDNVLFARSISMLLPVAVRQEDDRIQLMADEDRMNQD
jgi:transmembrane sensor